MKEDENFGLFKVPDSAIIKNQAIEIGILKSEIDELTYNLNKLEGEKFSYNKTNRKKVKRIKFLEKQLFECMTKSKL